MDPVCFCGEFTLSPNSPQRSCLNFPSAGHCCFPSFIVGLKEDLLSSSVVAPQGHFSLLHPLGERGVPDVSGITAIYNSKGSLQEMQNNPHSGCSDPLTPGISQGCESRAVLPVPDIPRAHCYCKQVFAACVLY